MTTRLSAEVSATVFELLFPLLSLAQQSQQPSAPPQPPWDWSGPWHMWHAGWGFWWIFPAFVLLMIVICVVIFLFGHRWGEHRHRGPWHMMDRPPGPGRSWGDPTCSAMEILNERFARGEIQKQEYDEKEVAILSRWQA